VKLSTNGYGGRTIQEIVYIQTNDIQQPRLSVIVKGSVEKFVEIKPGRAMLVGKAGTSAEQKIRIIPQDRYPFQVVKTRAKDGKNIQFHLEEVKSSEKKTYLLTVENRKPDKGRYYDQIFIDTDYPEYPVIRIQVMGNIL
jgi:hypothetical protein